jgi:hypothetical protein
MRQIQAEAVVSFLKIKSQNPQMENKDQAAISQVLDDLKEGLNFAVILHQSRCRPKGNAQLWQAITTGPFANTAACLQIPAPAQVLSLADANPPGLHQAHFI